MNVSAPRQRLRNRRPHWQHGCPIETIRHALARPGGGAGPLATLLDEVESQRDGDPHD
jgi:hypothetical protein